MNSLSCSILFQEEKSLQFPGRINLYVFAVQTSNVQPGVVCINLNAADTVTDPACTGTGGQPAGFTPLAAAGSSGWTAGTGTGSTTFAYYGGKLYDWNPAAGHTASTGGGGASGNGDNAELCYDIATQSACTGEPYAVSVSASSAATNTDATSGPAYSTTLVGSDLFIPTSWSTGGVVACLQLDLATPGNCAGTWPQTLGLTTSSMVIPSLDSSGNSTGVCGFTGSLWQCWNFDGTSQPTPAGLTSSVLQSWQWAGSPAVVGTRIFQIVPANPNGLVYCYDFATDGACTTSTGHFPISLANSSNIYSVTADSQRPTCLWTNADTGSEQIQNFDALTGGSCASAPVRVFASSFVEPYQACVPTQFTSITLTSGNLATGSTPTLSFTNGNGVVIDGPYPFTMTGSQPTLNLTTLAYPTPIDLSTKSALPQFVLNLTPGTGGLGTIGVEASWSGSQLAQCTPGYTGPAPSTASASSVADTSAQLNGSVNNTSTDTVSPVQFCYQTTTFTSGQCTGTVVSATPGTVSASVTPYSTSLTGLTHSTTYYYELVATDATTASALYGGVQSFTTGPTLTTGPATSVANTSATLTGSLYNPAGDTLVSGPSFCYQTTSFTVGTCTGTTTQAVAGTSSPSGTEYSLGLTGLTAGQTYYFEALATDQTTGGAIYGQVQSFTAAPIVTASPVTHIADTSATANGNLYNPNGDSAQVQFCYSTTSFSSGPCSGTLAGSIAGATVGSTSAWSSNLTSLSPGTTYYVEMVVTDSTLSTTFYSPVETFTTGPVITTTAALNTRSNSTTLSANLYNPGTDSGTTVTFCYSTTSFLSGGCGSTPVAASAGTTSGSTTVYTANLTSLTPGATYYYEAVLNDPAATPTVRYGGVQTVVTGPIVTTAAATGSTSSATTLNGTINNPNSVSLGSITFCYQLTTFTSGGCTGSSVSAVAGSTIGTTTSYSAQINSLNPYTSYYYELVSTPSVGAPYYGGVDTFQTAGITPAISTATITGTPTVGQTLTAHSSGVSGAPTPTESYQWLDNGTAITGATGSTYVVTPSDFGHALTVTITETNSVGVASATSVPASNVAGLAPTITTATITGTPTVGQTLTAHSTGVTGTPTPTESYQWLDNGTAIPGANSSTYVVPSADYHQPITVTITETNSVGVASATSLPTTLVAGLAPTITTATITGTPTVGQTLTAHSTGVTGTPTPTESYQWFDNGTAITGATGSTYVVTPSDFGHALTVTITETNSVGVASATSLPTTLVAGLAPTITTATITGTPTVGQTLTAHSTGVTGTPTPTESYQWLDNGTAITGATSVTYVVTPSDFGHALTVTITETNSVGAASATSSPTTSVASNQPPVISTVVVSPTGTGVITWSPTPNVPSSDYVVQYTTNGGKTWVTVPSSDISGTTATVPGLNTSSNFQFRVSTTTSAGSTTSVSKATTPTKVFPTSPISLPSKPFAAYRATFGASANDIKVIITTLREVSALHLKSVTIIGYAIYETKAHDGKGKYLTMNQVRNLAKSRAYSAIKFMQGLERKLHIAPVKFVVKPVIEMGKSHLKNFEKFRRVALQI